jgi:hypothetical protein
MPRYLNKFNLKKIKMHTFSSDKNDSREDGTSIVQVGI